jgi:hypothetical protein
MFISIHVYPQIMTNRIYLLIAAFVLLICILSLYIPVNARVNSTTATSTIGSPKSLLVSHISPAGGYNINVNGTTGNLIIRVVSSNNDVDGIMSLHVNQQITLLVSMTMFHPN